MHALRRASERVQANPWTMRLAAVLVLADLPYQFVYYGAIR